MSLVDLTALGLPVWALHKIISIGSFPPDETEPAQIFSHGFVVLRVTTLAIRILDSQQENTAVFAREQIIEQGRARVAQM
jgi:hypothetical protein